MSLIFYAAPMSTAVITEVVLAELGIPHEKVTVDLKAGESKKPAYLEKNPNGLVPTIDHDGELIWESVAITLYLGETFGVEKGLFPAPGPARARAMKWLVWGHVTLGMAINIVARNTTKWYPEDERNAKQGESAKAEAHKCLGILDAALNKSPYLTGETYTLADAHLHSLISWVGMVGIDLSTYEHISAWSKTCSERPAYKQVMATMPG
jgi:glutathione S-transferase